jgi:hypothetical protein
MIMVPGQLEQKKVLKTPSQQKNLRMVALASHSSYSGKLTIGGLHSPGQPWKKVRPYLQNNQSKNDWRMLFHDKVLS